MTMTMRFRLAVGIVALALPGEVLAQGVVARACPVEEMVPDLGITGLDCVGECQVTLDERGRERLWRFSVEPRILGVREGSAADGHLRGGDRLVAVDESLITTREGGRRFANLATGETVRIRFRREGRIGEETLRVGSRCDTGARARLVGRVPPPPPLAASPVEPVVPDVVTAPRIVYERPPVEPEPAPVPVVLELPSLPPAGPVGRLGASFSCGNCGTRTDPATGDVRWFFSAPLEITDVEPGGAVDRAGIQVGDLIAAIDGAPVDSDEGGAAFSALKPGEAVTFTVVRRDGRRTQVRVVPSEPVGAALATPAAPAEADVGRPVSAAPVRPAKMAEPFDMAKLPLRFVDSVAGVEVEVRGVPVEVSSYRGERTLIIEVGGTWIRIEVPPGGVPKP